eukprot:4785800-Alexandrium_andersonii.AAC.1
MCRPDRNAAACGPSRHARARMGKRAARQRPFPAASGGCVGRRAVGVSGPAQLGRCAAHGPASRPYQRARLRRMALLACALPWPVHAPPACLPGGRAA